MKPPNGKYQLFNGKIDSQDKLTNIQINSFQDGYETVLLPIAFVLWRFASQKNSNPYGPFLMDSDTMQSIMSTLHKTHNFSQGYKKENIRNSLAIRSDWSHLNWRVKIKLQKPTVAYVGKVGYQAKVDYDYDNTLPFGGSDTISKVMEERRGDKTQIVIPRFSSMPFINEWAIIEVFVHI